VAISADRWLTQVDPWVNILRGTAATLGAVVGGADAVTLAPFDSAGGLPGDLGRRLARNTQLLLQDESGIGRVLDPAGGSWYIESRSPTNWPRLAGSSSSASKRPAGRWKRSTRSAPTSRWSRRRRDAADRHAQAAHHRRQRVPAARTSSGRTALPDPPPDTDRRLRNPGRRRDGLAAGPPGRAVRGTARERWGRDGLPGQPRPHRRAHRPQATFAANLFAAAGSGGRTTGIRTPTPRPAAFADSGADIACICSSDDVYGELAAATAAALKQAGAKRVYLAGKGDYDGVDEYIHLGVDVLDVLTRAEAAR
jgi:methylmalonyl-CoA mutase